LDRRSFVLSAAALAAAPAVAASQTPTRLRIAAAVDEDVAGVLWAQSTDAYAKAGLDVELQKAQSGAAVAAAVAGGSLEIGKSSLGSLITAHTRGLPFVLVAPAGLYDAEAPVVAMLVAKSSPIRSAKDLIGKTLAVSALGDQFDLAMRAWMDQNGGDSTSVHFIEMPISAVPDALAAGRIAAATVGNPILAKALAGGECRILAHPFDAVAKQLLYTAFFCTADFAAKNRDVLDRFRKVTLQAAEFVDKHHDRTTELLAKFTGVGPAAIRAMTYVTVGTTVDPKLIQPWIATAYKYKAISSQFDAKAMIDPGALA
jgi:NitT/TauT family transport system substrate-binding protein